MGFPYRQALFDGLVFGEEGKPVATAFVGDEPHYVVLDGDFRRHVPAEQVDRQVIEWIKEQATANKDLVSEQMMKLLGKDDLFTKAMIDASITNMDKQVMQQGLPEDARMMLGLMGFKVIVNVHGEVVDLKAPAADMPDEDEW